jgi:hypothetical protein
MLPKDRLDELILNAAIPAGAAPNCKANVCDTPPALAVTVAVWAELTEETEALKAALVAPAGTITEAGTVTALLSLARVVLIPPAGAGALNAAVQESVAAPVKLAFAQLNELRVGMLTEAPMPLRLITAVPPPEELLVIVNCPVADPAVVGAKFTLRLKVAPAATVAGTLLPPFNENDCPATLIVEICTAAEP